MLLLDLAMKLSRSGGCCEKVPSLGKAEKKGGWLKKTGVFEEYILSRVSDRL